MVSPTEAELALAADALTEFGRLADDYERQKQAAEDRAAEWVWYTDFGADPRPLEFERNGQAGPPGQRLAEKPSNVVGCVLHGFDDSGRVVVTRRYSSADDHDDTLFDYRDEWTDVAGYVNRGRRLFRYERLLGPIETPSAWASAGRTYAVVFRLRYEGGRLVQVDTIGGMAPDRTPELEATQHVNRDRDGRITEVWRERPDGYRVREYPPRETSAGTAPEGAGELVAAFDQFCNRDDLTPRQALMTFAELVQRDVAGGLGYEFEFLLVESGLTTENGERRLTWAVSQILSRTGEDADQPAYFGFRCAFAYPLTDPLTTVAVDAEERDPDDDPVDWLTRYAARPEIALLEAADPAAVDVTLDSHD